MSVSSEIFSIVRDAFNGPRYRRELERIYEAQWKEIAPGIAVQRNSLGRLDFRLTDAQGRWRGTICGGGWNGERPFTALENWQEACSLAGLPEDTPPPAALLALLDERDGPRSGAASGAVPVPSVSEFKGP